MRTNLKQGFTQHYSHSAGFTLIELLVVIAIIGILSAVVLASLNTARSRGNDAAIQANLSTIRTQAVLYYDDNGNSYGTQTWSSGNATACNAANTMFDDSNINRALAAADTANGAGNVDCWSNNTNYVVAAALAVNPNTYWCIDSLSQGELVNAPLPTTEINSCP
ncbi:MAG: type II secretion system protein [bacterium]|nr:type II secretion system protein [bacterium]